MEKLGEFTGDIIMPQFILIHNTRIEGQTAPAYYAESMIGKGKFVLFGEDAALRFSDPIVASKIIDKVIPETGWLQKDFSIVPTEKPASWVMPI